MTYLLIYHVNNMSVLCMKILHVVAVLHTSMCSPQNHTISTPLPILSILYQFYFLNRLILYA